MNDETILEEDRIYSPNKEYWCGKTSKESSERFFETLEETKKKLETRSVNNPIIPPDSEWDVIVGGLVRFVYNPESMDYERKSRNWIKREDCCEEDVSK